MTRHANFLSRRKFREAAYFLGEMRRRDGSPHLALEEEFGYFLSAFLSAARSVSFVLRKENPATYCEVRDLWLAAMTPSMRAFLDVMRDQRNTAQKEGTDFAHQDEEYVSPMEAYGARSAIVPVILPWAFAEGAAVGVTRYALEIDNVSRPAVATCQEYLAALNDLITGFER